MIDGSYTPPRPNGHPLFRSKARQLPPQRRPLQNHEPTTEPNFLFEMAGAGLFDTGSSSSSRIESDSVAQQYDIDSSESSSISIGNLEKAGEQFEAEYQKMKLKIHRFPAGLQGVGPQYIRPMAVAIGPYYHGRNELNKMEKVKNVAAYHLVRDSRHSLEKMHEALLPIADQARSLYAAEVVGHIRDDEFVSMMFIDACFLLQYMLKFTAREKLGQSLLCCFNSNQACIDVDIMLLENQLPWLVVETLLSFVSVPVEVFAAKMAGTLQIRHDLHTRPFSLDGYKPPHLLALMRFYVTGSNTSRVPPPDVLRSMSIPSAIELAEIGIKLTASKKKEMKNMGIKKTLLFGKLFLTPLFLDKTRACWLVNMAAFEICTSSGFWADDENIVVCSYLSVLPMLMDREEDVHELRSKRLVKGTTSNKDTLDYFKMVMKYLYGGPLYYNIMVDVEAYKQNRWAWIKVHEFVYKNFKAIVTVFSVIGVLVGIFKTLMSLKQHQL